MEFHLINPQNNAFANAIEFNYDELKEYLSEQLQKYRGLVYTDESIGAAKSDRATLNKLKSAIDDKRKEIKKECLKPYEEFEAKIKDLFLLIDEPILAIDNQVKEYENSQREEKRSKIEAFYTENIGDLEKLLPLSRIWDNRWLNVTYAYGSITNEISAAINKVAEDMTVINELKSEFELQIKDKYLQTLDLSFALKEKTRLEDQKAKMEEYERSKKQQQEESQTVLTPEQVKSVQPTVVSAGPDVSQVLEQIDFRVWVTPAQKKAMREFFIANEIKVGKVE